MRRLRLPHTNHPQRAAPSPAYDTTLQADHPLEPKLELKLTLKLKQTRSRRSS